VVAGNKADRLLLIINRETPAEAEKVDVVYVPPSTQREVTSTAQASKEGGSPPHHDITPRRRHDPHHLKRNAAKRRAYNTKHVKKRSVTSQQNKLTR
jgi:hypothetical protein